MCKSEISLIKYLWHYANDVYKIDKLAKRKKPYQKGRETTDYHFNKTDGYALTWIKSRKELIVSWVGTRSLRGWIENFDGIDRKELKHKEGRVHEGFWEGYSPLKNVLIGACKVAIANQYSVYFTGHSRGGAMAVISAQDIKKKLPDDLKQYVKKCIIFAAPMQGGPLWKKSVEKIIGKDLLRVNTRYDRVPKLRLQCMFGYKHVGKEIVLKTSSFPFFPPLRALINHTQRCYTKYINKL